MLQEVENPDCGATFQHWAGNNRSEDSSQHQSGRSRHVSFAHDTKTDDEQGAVHTHAQGLQPASFVSSSGIAASRAMQQLADTQGVPQPAASRRPDLRPAAPVPQQAHARAPPREATAHAPPQVHQHAHFSSGNRAGHWSSGMADDVTQLRMEREHIAAVRANMEQGMRALEQERSAFETERVRPSCLIATYNAIS